MNENSMDDYMWNDGSEYFIEYSNFDRNNKTKMRKGSTLNVYTDGPTGEVKGVYFASPTGYWIPWKEF